MPFNWKSECSVEKTMIVSNSKGQYIAYNPCNRQVAFFEMAEFDISAIGESLHKNGFRIGGNIPSRSLSLTFSVSDKCGMDCIYCFSGNKASVAGGVANFSNAVPAIDSFFFK